MKKVAVLGYGVVGSGVIELIDKNYEKIKKDLNEEIVLKKILVKNKDSHVGKKHFDLICTDMKDVLNEDIDIVVEVMGGIHPAYEYIKTFLESGKNVVTANKDLISKFGDELLEIAHKNGVRLKFEASVGGGIPILRPLSLCLGANDFNRINAILNGTTNFILSKMDSEGMDYDEALKIAQDLGFAEANPESDVMGYDSARKLCILSSMAYNTKIDWEDFYLEGINNIDKIDINFAKNNGYNIKLVAMSERQDDKIYASVRPVLVDRDSQISKVENEFNVIMLEGDAVGEVMFFGKGAGKLPTGSAIYGDILDIVQNKNKKEQLIEREQGYVLKNYECKSKWAVRVNNDNKEQVINSLKEEFGAIELYEDNDIFVIVEEKKESLLKEKLDNIKKKLNLKEMKSMMILAS